ncbi:MAG: hypothetical protein HY706_12120 [Candidatus Hydrogenedentes bacterium]|nr:hypothetical protein [Candidatus Hydrogenedentota bacterium]
MFLDFVRDFTPHRYMTLTRLEGMGWTLADVVIVFLLIRIANLCRGYQGRRVHIFSYAVLASTLPFLPIIATAEDGMVFFCAELVVTVPHFVLILYVMLGDAQIGTMVLRELVCRKNSEQRGQG